MSRLETPPFRMPVDNRVDLPGEILWGWRYKEKPRIQCGAGNF